MKLTITLRMDNAAFEHHGQEVARILERVADDVRDFESLKGLNNTLRDTNGNQVGTAKVTK